MKSMNPWEACNTTVAEMAKRTQWHCGDSTNTRSQST